MLDLLTKINRLVKEPNGLKKNKSGALFSAQNLLKASIIALGIGLSGDVLAQNYPGNRVKQVEVNSVEQELLNKIRVIIGTNEFNKMLGNTYYEVVNGRSREGWRIPDDNTLEAVLTKNDLKEESPVKELFRLQKDRKEALIVANNLKPVIDEATSKGFSWANKFDEYLRVLQAGPIKVDFVDGSFGGVSNRELINNVRVIIGEKEFNKMLGLGNTYYEVVNGRRYKFIPDDNKLESVLSENDLKEESPVKELARLQEIRDREIDLANKLKPIIDEAKRRNLSWANKFDEYLRVLQAGPIKVDFVDGSFGGVSNRELIDNVRVIIGEKEFNKMLGIGSRYSLIDENNDNIDCNKKLLFLLDEAKKRKLSWVSKIPIDNCEYQISSKFEKSEYKEFSNFAGISRNEAIDYFRIFDIAPADLRKYQTNKVWNIDDVNRIIMTEYQTGSIKNNVLIAKYGFTDLMRVPVKILEKMKSGYNSPEEQKKDMALVILPKSDWNGAFRNDKETYHSLLKGYNVYFYEVNSDIKFQETVEFFGDEMGKKNKKIDLLIIGGHGTSGTINFGNSADFCSLKKPAEIIRDMVNLDLTDKELKNLSKYFNSTSKIVLNSCSTGAGGCQSGNIAYYISEAFAGIEVIAPNKPTNIVNMIYDQNGKVIGVNYNSPPKVQVEEHIQVPVKKVSNKSDKKEKSFKAN